MTRVYQRRHQSRLAPGENAINPAVLFRTPEDQPIDITQVAQVVRTNPEPGRETGGAGVAVAAVPGLLAGGARGNPLRVAEHDRVNFATYKLEGPAGAWWEGFLALQPPDHDVNNHDEWWCWSFNRW